MTIQNNWILKGTFYECCRVEDGHCALWFGRDLPRACSNLVTYQIKEGQIHSIDMQGIIIIFHQDGIGPKVADLMKGAEEGAIYISDNATGEQRTILESFARERMDARMWKKCLGVKFVNININKDNHQYHITMPYGEQKMSLAIGGDRKTPMRLENPPMPFLANVRFCNTLFWKYHDYGKNLAFQNTSGVMADFAFKGL